MLYTIKYSTLPEEAAQGVTLLDFCGAWCAPCAALAPTIEKIADNYTVCKCDIDQNPDLSAQYGIMSVPTLVVLDKGNERERMVGVHTEQEILTCLGKER